MVLSLSRAPGDSGLPLFARCPACHWGSPLGSAHGGQSQSQGRRPQPSLSLVSRMRGYRAELLPRGSRGWGQRVVPEASCREQPLCWSWRALGWGHTEAAGHRACPWRGRGLQEGRGPDVERPFLRGRGVGTWSCGRFGSRGGVPRSRAEWGGGCSAGACGCWGEGPSGGSDRSPGRCLGVESAEGQALTVLQAPWREWTRRAEQGSGQQAQRGGLSAHLCPRSLVTGRWRRCPAHSLPGTAQAPLWRHRSLTPGEQMF